MHSIGKDEVFPSRISFYSRSHNTTDVSGIGSCWAYALESTPARPFSGQKIDTGLRPSIEKLTAKANRQEGHIQLRWEYKVAGVQKYINYRAEGVDQLTMLTTVTAGSKTTYTDKAVKPSRSYQYLVQDVFEDGAMSRRGERISLTY